MDIYKQKYEKALENFKKIKAANKDNKELVDFIEYEYPELKESEDEKIRKMICGWIYTQPSSFFDSRYSKEDVLAWLEKQGEQSKQHLYDIIIALWDLLDKIDTFSDLQIDDINPDNPFRKIEHITQERHKFVKSDGYNLYIKGEQITDFKQDEQRPADKVEPKFKVGDTIVEKDVDECDYETIKDIKNGRYIFTDGYCMNIDEQEGWQLVKTTVNIEQKSAWSEEDEEILEGLNNCLTELEENNRWRYVYINNKDVEIDKIRNWLKSLKDRYTWKPSDEQMHYLSWIANIKLGDSVVEQEVSKHLNELLEDLKKLSGE